jgi:hypothetical protein
MIMEVLSFENMDKVQFPQMPTTPKNATPQVIYALSMVVLLVVVIMVCIIQSKSQENKELAESKEKLLAENMRLGEMLRAKAVSQK